jgi:hypothetical protein
VVPGVVADEAELAEDDRQEDGDAQRPPRVADERERGPIFQK